MPEVYVIDDDEGIRRSLTFLLRSAGSLVRTYDSAAEFLREADQLAPGCVITDVRMPDMDGLELVRQLKAANLPMAAIVITGHGDIPLAVEAMKVGAVDFIEKPFRDDVLLGAVDKALSRGAPGPRAEADVGDEGMRALFAALSPREREVLGSVVLGKTNKMIARDFAISPRTVEVHRASVMMKTGARTLSELVRMALLAKF
ncbi:MAG: response regulator [Alphaproteobacteria bacterium]|nr:response regulator [Alphaproteobacteria bacterium]MBU1516548.1 response regulator [Alphaproteobacteria bacterium]MBU2094305.1 response regulator [Alphaproteobacteria bacterium]MBU2154118.1 response regulator [Alphaproteobacteria bacterium]MBU2307475.1 response regulator [Alphaproteobacteria bacterium]